VSVAGRLAGAAGTDVGITLAAGAVTVATLSTALSVLVVAAGAAVGLIAGAGATTGGTLTGSLTSWATGFA